MYIVLIVVYTYIVRQHQDGKSQSLFIPEYIPLNQCLFSGGGIFRGICPLLKNEVKYNLIFCGKLIIYLCVYNGIGIFHFQQSTDFVRDSKFFFYSLSCVETRVFRSHEQLVRINDKNKMLSPEITAYADALEPISRGRVKRPKRYRRVKLYVCEKPFLFGSNMKKQKANREIQLPATTYY